MEAHFTKEPKRDACSIIGEAEFNAVYKRKDFRTNLSAGTYLTRIPSARTAAKWRLIPGRAPTEYQIRECYAKSRLSGSRFNSERCTAQQYVKEFDRINGLTSGIVEWVKCTHEITGASAA